MWYGFFSSAIQTVSASYSAATGSAIVGEGSERTYDYVVSTFLPWLEDPFYEASTSDIETNQNYPYDLGLFLPYINNSMVIIGRQATYGLAAIAYDADHIGVNFAYNPLSWYGSTSDRHVGNLETLSGATDYLRTVFTTMYNMWKTAMIGTGHSLVHAQLL